MMEQHTDETRTAHRKYYVCARYFPLCKTLKHCVVFCIQCSVCKLTLMPHTHRHTDTRISEREHEKKKERTNDDDWRNGIYLSFFFCQSPSLSLSHTLTLTHRQTLLLGLSYSLTLFLRFLLFEKPTKKE